ncbi:MAG TPA: DUF397 domain-containing protein [Streptosporangiaceae bacterium]|jgi:hypothetical protein
MKNLQRELSLAIWRKSTHSGSGDQCVEVAAISAGRRAVRDSKDPHGPALVFAPREWKALLTAVRHDH